MIQKVFFLQHKLGEICFLKVGFNRIILDLPFGVMFGVPIHHPLGFKQHPLEDAGLFLIGRWNLAGSCLERKQKVPRWWTVGANQMPLIPLLLN